MGEGDPINASVAEAGKGYFDDGTSSTSQPQPLGLQRLPCVLILGVVTVTGSCKWMFPLLFLTLTLTTLIGVAAIKL